MVNLNNLQEIYQEGSFILYIKRPLQFLECCSDGLYRNDDGTIYGKTLAIPYENVYNAKTQKINPHDQGILNLKGIYGENPYTKEREYGNDKRK